MKKADKQTAAAIAALGYRPGRRVKHGQFWDHPSGARIQIAGSAGDRRSMANAVADARRQLARIQTTNSNERK